MSLVDQLHKRTVAAREEHSRGASETCATFAVTFAHDAIWYKKILNACENAADQGKDTLVLVFSMCDGIHGIDGYLSPYYDVMVNDVVMMDVRKDTTSHRVTYSALYKIHGNWNEMGGEAARALGREFGLHCEPVREQEYDSNISFEFSWKSE